MFNKITGINEWKTLTKQISCECKCKFHARKCNSDQWWKSNKCWCECKKHNVCEKDYIWNPATCNCENEKYLANILENSTITCDEIIESFDGETKTVQGNFNRKKATCKLQNFYILLAFLSII